MQRGAGFSALVPGLAVCLGAVLPAGAVQPSGSLSPVATPATVYGAHEGWTVSQAVGRGALRGFLDGVSCPLPGQCTAVGTRVAADGEGRALVETSSGATWEASELALPAGMSQTFLFGISCPTTTWCAAVGYSYADGTAYPLIETFSGGTWSVGRPPAEPAGTTVGLLNGVSCTERGSCVAVGWVRDAANPEQPWAAALADGRWTAYSSKALLATEGMFNNVSCGQAGACVAVGNRLTDAGLTTLVATLRAGKWGTTTHELRGTDGYAPGLTSVDCRPDGGCVAVGELGNLDPPVLLTGRATDFSSHSLPSPVSDEGATGLWGVSCASSSGCTAVGAMAQANIDDVYDGALPDPQGILIEHQSDGTWAAQAAPPGLPAQSGLHGVACVATSCVAVGMTGQAPTDQTFTADTLIIETEGITDT